MYEIEFDVGCDDCAVRYPLAEMTDDCIQKTRLKAEADLGRKLVVCDRSNFPSFTIYEDGEETAGG